jgi:hypothetical protein
MSWHDDTMHKWVQQSYSTAVVFRSATTICLAALGEFWATR